MAKVKKAKTGTVERSAKTGKFAKKGTELKSPAKTVRETVRKMPQKKG